MISLLGIKHTSISFNATACTLETSSVTNDLCPSKSPLTTIFTIWSLPLALSLDNLQMPSLTQYTPLIASPSLKITSPFFMVFDILQLEMRTNSSFVKDFNELNCFMIHCSHFPISLFQKIDFIC